LPPDSFSVGWLSPKGWHRVRERMGMATGIPAKADLPAAVSENSIRVEGETSGSLEIGSVDARPIVVKMPKQASAPDDTERRRIEERDEDL
jgi:hypothetical protein